MVKIRIFNKKKMQLTGRVDADGPFRQLSGNQVSGNQVFGNQVFGKQVFGKGKQAIGTIS